jgi:hypothetical protein
VSLTTIVILLVGVVALAGVLLWRPTHRAAASGDARVIEELRRVGSRIDQPHLIEFFMYFPSEAGAREVAGKLTGQAFEVQVTEVAEGDLKWQAFATKSMVPLALEMERLRTVLTAMCAKEHGIYDGWGAPVVQ